MVINAGFCKKFSNLWKSPIALLILLRTLFKWFLNVKLESRMTLRCFWDAVRVTVLLLKIKGECFTLFAFLQQITSWTCLLESEWKVMFYCSAGIYLLKINSRNTRTKCEIYSNVTTKTPVQRYWCCSGVFIVKFEHISHLVLVFLLLTLNM